MAFTEHLDDNEQDLLSLAAVAPKPLACDAWNTWKKKYLTSAHEQLETRFTPEIYRRLTKWNLVDENLELLKQARQTTWFRNHALVQKTLPLLNLLEQNNIPFHLLKGCAFINGFFNDYGYRYTRDVDILVPYPLARQAFELIQNNGWLLLEESARDYIRVHHGLSFGNDDCATVDLHWHLLPYYLSKQFDELALKNSSSAKIGNIECQILGVNEQLFHSLLHGQMCPHNSYWLLDAKRLLELANFEINWEHILQLGKASKTSYLLTCALEELREVNPNLVTREVVSQFQSSPISSVEKLEGYTREHGTSSLFGGLPTRISEFARSGFAQDESISLLKGAILYFCFQWKLDSSYQLPKAFISKVFSVLFRRITKQNS